MWGGWINLTTPRPRRRTIRTVALITAVAAAAWLLPEPKSYIDWRQYDRTLIDQTVKDQKPVLMEFMADWCITCKAVEKTVYHRKDVAELIRQKGVLPMKANTTLDDSPATIDLKDRYKEPGVPVTILFVPGQTEPKRFHGLIIGGDLKKALHDLPDVQGQSPY
jgi:thiol:disulfide interchange protein DsbD